ncbi:mechanosensitive ion channel family protein [Prevotella sp. Rep29]|uniref:mechanosensitive ion channel family protein n=1 Tax=Prevotella sp. Rep29 TaxID=2691580 RepID=UPI001C6EBAC3|nr:mechanosensitive ion channel domain-containing protein [Prevotella sp. Rep29]QYR09936.1 mechanosensitive ion channel [Prevotella sp. Rep29]
MENIKIFVEQILELSGLTGNAVPVVRHILLVIIAVILAWLAALFCRKLIVPLILKITNKIEVKWAQVLFNRKVLISACNIVPAIVVWQLLPMVFYQYPVVREVLARLTAIYITIMTVRTIVVFIDSFKKLEDERRSSMQQYFHSFCGVLKIILMFLATIAVVSIIINKSPATLIAGLGATSAILMLVFKDTIEGLVAGIRLTSNEMLHKGDWITVEKAGADGTVEEMTLTTVKIRNFDNTIVTVSPKTLVDDSFQNWIGMQESDGRRAKRKIFFDFRSLSPITDEQRQQLIEKKYFKPEEIKEGDINMTLFRQYMEKYLASREDVNADMTLMVRQLEATSTGMPVELYFFIRNKEWVVFEHTVAEIMEYTYATAKDFNLKIYQQLPDRL